MQRAFRVTPIYLYNNNKLRKVIEKIPGWAGNALASISDIAFFAAIIGTNFATFVSVLINNLTFIYHPIQNPSYIELRRSFTISIKELKMCFGYSTMCTRLRFDRKT